MKYIYSDIGWRLSPPKIIFRIRRYIIEFNIIMSIPVIHLTPTIYQSGSHLSIFIIIYI